MEGFILFLVISCVVASASAWRVESCVDDPIVVTPGQAPDPWRFSKSFAVSSVAGKTSWDLEGSDPKIAQEIVLSASISKVAGSRLFLFLEYINRSPRRISVQPVSGVGGGGILLLDGDSSSKVEWGNEMVEVDTLQDSIQVKMFVKKTQHVYVGKRVLVRVSDGVVPRATDFHNSSCEALQRASTPPATTLTTRQPTTTATRRQPASCGTTNQSGGGNVPGCPVCPECACVCNCNCGNKEC